MAREYRQNTPYEEIAGGGTELSLAAEASPYRTTRVRDDIRAAVRETAAAKRSQ